MALGLTRLRLGFTGGGGLAIITIASGGISPAGQLRPGQNAAANLPDVSTFDDPANYESSEGTIVSVDYRVNGQSRPLNTLLIAGGQPEFFITDSAGNEKSYRLPVVNFLTFTGTGDLTTSQVVADGAGVRSISAFGDIAIPPLNAFGSASQLEAIGGAGFFALPAALVSGQGKLERVGAGAIVLPTLDVMGDGTPVGTSSGAGEIPSSVTAVSGVGTVFSVITGNGVVVTPSILSSGAASATGDVANLTIDSVGSQQSNGNLAIGYTIDQDDSAIECLIYLDVTADPTPGNFGGDSGGGANAGGYTDLGTLALTTGGSNISLLMPTGFDNVYRIAFLTTGSATPVVSPFITLDTLAPADQSAGTSVSGEFLNVVYNETVLLPPLENITVNDDAGAKTVTSATLVTTNVSNDTIRVFVTPSFDEPPEELTGAGAISTNSIAVAGTGDVVPFDEVAGTGAATIAPVAISGAGDVTGVVSSDFVIQVATTGTNESFTLPHQNDGTFNYTMSSPTADSAGQAGQVVTAWNDANRVITFPSAGTHTITCVGTMPNVYFNNGGDKDKLVGVNNLGVMGWGRLDNAFYGCSNLTSFTAGNTDTSAVTNMSSMMRDWSSMVSPPNLTGLDTSSVANMNSMMRNWPVMTSPPDLSGFDTAAVTNMSLMMQDWPAMTSPPDLTSFNTAAVTTMTTMMSNWSSMTSPPDLTSFNTAAVTNMSSMMLGWSSVTSPPDLTGFDTAAVTNMTSMMQDWSSMTSPPDLTSFNTAAVTNMSSMMRNWSSMTSPPDLTSFNTAAVSNMSSMMQDWSSMTSPPNLSGFDTNAVTNMSSMMRNWPAMTSPPDLSGFDTADVTTMLLMMFNWSSMGSPPDIDGWNISGLNSASSLTNFMSGSPNYGTAWYDAVLNAWAAQTVQSGMSPNFGASEYSATGQVGRDILTNSPNNWNVIDGGLA